MTTRPIPLLMLGAASAVALVAGSGALSASQPSTRTDFPAPPEQKAKPSGDRVAVLAGGCFWGMEGLFEHVKGVKSVISGYAGGTKANATYARVSRETTRHAEAVRIVYDPAKVSYGTLLKIYFSVAHDPTQVNRQYPDTGPSYRSAIFPQTAAQRQIAQAYIARIEKAKVFKKPVATKLESGQFYPAETYHQDFMHKNPNNSYTNRYDKPKISAFRKAYPDLYKS
ncbi:peptide-methionine (S)-S-oxide reductase MsrA [Novosphingobium mangrovi (ex Huang et al. 2023)]|uniref:Peptide methionine sulfoxide reductase MsrA n=1 Tax=Novosphingobium mangrovi (ex Huang et al. 2023) TaxID=2976432 RepID=A0ABT2I2H0_9SPHN|nr:peptide-methionine (S)-S-oxide reductase MsrA [Novosphingobium mangrovi (ex Huang et al. 2023)]MCT2399000.1 peptide-methionine (S)-S-oxide reductase MsrA [Novosphingobium mangrovi (ex Huang et al. 2023)]